MTGEDLRPIEDVLNGAPGGRGIIGGNVLEDIFDLLLCFFRPSYCCHARMQCAIRSFEMVRFASESASPRSTIT